MVYGLWCALASSPTWYVSMCVFTANSVSKCLKNTFYYRLFFKRVVILMDSMVYGIRVYGIRVYGKWFMVCTC
jgi:hypothetical protein